MAVKSIGLSKAGGRKPCSLLDAARHNLREIQAELGASGRIDPKQTGRNEVLAGPADAAGVVALAHRVASAAGIDPAKLRRDHVQAVELVFSLPPDTTQDVGQHFRRCLAWVRQAFGGVEVLQAVAHFDESVPHCHVLLAPYQRGRHVGGGLIDRAALGKLRDSFWRNVAGPAGLKRAGAKLYGQSRRTVADAVLARLEVMRDPVLKSAVLRLVRGYIEADPLPWAEALGIDPGSCSKALPKAIGFDDPPPSPIGFAQVGQKGQSLSCVGIAHQTPQLDRLSIARQAAASALAKHAHHKPKPKPKPTPQADRVDDDGLVREPDLSFDPNVCWGDF